MECSAEGRALAALADRRIAERHRSSVGKDARQRATGRGRDGGFVPALRERSGRALSLAEREEISRGLSVGWSFRQIGKTLGRAASTVSREVGGESARVAYRAATAD